MKTLPATAFLRFSTLVAGIIAGLTLQASHAQTTGFNQTGAGPYDYNNTANWVGGTINGLWSSSLAIPAGQVLEFSTSTALTTGLTFLETGGQNKTLRSTGGATTMTLGGDILLNAAGNVTYTIGSTTGASNLHVDLGGAVRTVTAFGSGNSGNFGKTFTFTNNVSNGGIIASGGGSGGGKVQFNALSISLSSAEVRDVDLSFNGSNNTSANSVYTISGALTGGGGASAITVLPRTGGTNKNALVSAGSFVRNAGSTVLFRGTSLGTTTIASATAAVANISFGSIALTGGGGGNGQTTIGIIAGAFGDTSGTGTGFGATGGLVTYDAANGVRLLSGSEYKSSITDQQTALDNVRIANSSGAINTTTLTAATTTTINSLSLDVSGATGNQGITITGGAGAILKLNSGVIYANQNVTTGTSPATTDAMTINVSTLDLNGKEGIILASTKMNSGGTISSNGGLIINSTITNGTGLTIADGVGGTGGYVVLGGASANTYTGNTTINGAIVQFNKSTSNTFGDVVVNLGSLYNTGNQIADASNLTINGGVFYLNGSNNSGSATNETINNLTMGNGTVSSGSGNSNTFNVNGNASLSGGTINMPRNAKLNIGGTTGLSGGVISVGDNNSASIYNSKTTLAGAVTITNTAAGTAAYTPITIAAGAAATNLGGQVELTGDLTFVGNTNTNTVTIAAPTGTGLQGVMALNGTRVFDVGNGSALVDLTVNAPFIDGTATGGLTKSGLGTLALNGAGTYTGGTTVSAGTLLVNNTTGSATGTGAVTVNGGTLGGSGTIGGAVTVKTGATLAPGNSPGLLTVGSLVLESGSITAFEIAGIATRGTDYDAITVTTDSGLTLAGAFTIEFTNIVALDNATNINLFGYTGSHTGDFGSLVSTGFYAGTWNRSGETLSLVSGGQTLTFSELTGNLTIVPEPATWALLAFSLTTVLVLRRRRA